MNGRPTIRVNGGQLLRRLGWTGVPAGNDQAFTVLVVARAAQLRRSSMVAWWASNGLDAVRCELSTGGTLSKVSVSRDDGFYQHQTFGLLAIGDHEAHAIGCRYKPEILTDMLDGTWVIEDPATLTQPSLAPLAPDVFLIGARSDLPTELFQGDISEVVVVGRSLTDTELQAFHSYSVTQWGTP